MIDGWVVTVEEVQRAEEYLESDFFSEVYTKFKEFNRTPKFKEFNRTPPWYRALDGRPTNLRELAIHLTTCGRLVLPRLLGHRGPAVFANLLSREIGGAVRACRLLVAFRAPRPDRCSTGGRREDDASIARRRSTWEHGTDCCSHIDLGARTRSGIIQRRGTHVIPCTSGERHNPTVREARSHGRDPCPALLKIRG